MTEREPFKGWSERFINPALQAELEQAAQQRQLSTPRFVAEILESYMESLRLPRVQASGSDSDVGLRQDD
jgi:hypothetical protein